MLIRFNLLESFIKYGQRIFKSEKFKNDTHQSMQYHNGGEDYNPELSTEALGSQINNNPAETVIYLFKDGVSRICNPGEKRIYSTDSQLVKASIHLKNDGNIQIEGNDFNLTLSGNANITTLGVCSLVSSTVNITASQSVSINSPVTNLGFNGKKVVLDGDTVQVDPSTHIGTVTASGKNTSI